MSRLRLCKMRVLKYTLKYLLRIHCGSWAMVPCEHLRYVTPTLKAFPWGRRDGRDRRTQPRVKPNHKSGAVRTKSPCLPTPLLAWGQLYQAADGRPAHYYTDSILSLRPILLKFFIIISHSFLFSFIFWYTDRYKILHMLRQLCCRSMCNNL